MVAIVPDLLFAIVRGSTHRALMVSLRRKIKLESRHWKTPMAHCRSTPSGRAVSHLLLGYVRVWGWATRAPRT
jgi:hypothetical protein